MEKMNARIHARIHAGVPQLFLTCVCIWSLLVNLFTVTQDKTCRSRCLKRCHTVYYKKGKDQNQRTTLSGTPFSTLTAWIPFVVTLVSGSKQTGDANSLIVSCLCVLTQFHMILKRGWDCWIYLCTWEAHVIITFASFQLDIAQHVRPLTLHKLHHAWLTDREDDERDSRVPSRVALRQKHTTTPNLND